MCLLVGDGGRVCEGSVAEPGAPAGCLPAHQLLPALVRFGDYLLSEFLILDNSPNTISWSLEQFSMDLMRLCQLTIFIPVVFV